MFYIIVYGKWGNCIIAENGEPTWELENAMTFKTRQDAASYINDNFKSWGEDAECFRVYEKEVAL